MSDQETDAQPKTTRFFVRTTEDNAARLEKAAALFKTTKSDLLREYGERRALEMYDAAIRATDGKTPA